MALYDTRLYQQALDELDENRQRVDPAPTKKQKLSRFTIGALIINRTIGSGIFVAQQYVLTGTGGSVGTALLLWAIGGLAAICGCLVWLEFGLSTPRHNIQGVRRGVPRNGGEKNYLEYFYSKPELLASCIFGVSFIALGNLSGNAYAFGRYVMQAAGRDPEDKGPVIGIAVAALTAVVLIHTCTRKGGILLNNLFAVFKILFLLAIIVIGIIKSTGSTLQDRGAIGDSIDENFGDAAFVDPPGGASGISDALFYVLYAYSGFEQPFYVLTEFAAPRKRFTRYVIATMVLVTLLFVGVNTAYSLVVPHDYLTNPPPGTLQGEDISSVFFYLVFGSDRARQATSALAATSIFGNLIVMTFTASRVKQEIAKEGILPFSIFWSTTRRSPMSSITAWWRRNVLRRPDPYLDEKDPENHREMIPIAALLLHWISSVVLVGATARLHPQTAYRILVSLYTYVNMVMMGLFVTVGLVLLKLVPRWNWAAKSHYGRINKWLGLVPPMLYIVFLAFLLIVPFIPPPSNAVQKYSHFIVPSIGISFLLWGTLWWLGLKLYMRVTHQRLNVERQTFVKQDPDVDDGYLQVAEIITHNWHSTIGEDQSDSDSLPVERIEVRGHKRTQSPAW